MLKDWIRRLYSIIGVECQSYIALYDGSQKYMFDEKIWAVKHFLPKGYLIQKEIEEGKNIYTLIRKEIEIVLEKATPETNKKYKKIIRDQNLEDTLLELTLKYPKKDFAQIKADMEKIAEILALKWVWSEKSAEDILRKKGENDAEKN